MDWTTVYAKTARGVMELSGKSKRLSRDLTRVLQLVDGKVSAEEILTMSGKMSETTLNQALESLRADGYVKVLMSGGHSQFVEDLGFPATIGVSEANTQAFLDAQAAVGERTKELAEKQAWNKELVELKQELDEELQRDADKIARTAAETKAKEEVAKQAKAEAVRIKTEQAEQALKMKLEAEAKAKAQEEAKAKIMLAERFREEAERKVRADADALAKREAETRKKAEEVERIRVEVESNAQAEAEAKEKLAAKAREEAEEKARAEAAAQSKREAEERAKIAEAARKIEAEAKAKAAAEMKAKEEAIARAEAEQAAYEAAQEIEDEQKRTEERLRKRLEARAKEEAEIKARADAEERARLEEIERAKAAEIARIIAEAEAKHRAEMEAKAKAEAQVKAEAQAKADAQEKAEAQARAEAQAIAAAQAKAEEEAKAEAQAKIEAQARAEAERIAQAAAEEQARLDAARQAREEAEMQARAAAEALARDEAERKEQAEAAELVRQQAEEQAKAEAAARIKAEAEAKIKEAEEVVARAKAEAEEAARQEAEQKSRELAAARSKAEAAAKAEAEAEDEERRQAEARAIALAEIKAREEERQTKLEEPFKPKRKPVKWVKPLLISLAALLILAIGLLHVITLNIYLPSIEKMASDRLHEPVFIQTVRGSLWPAPHLKLEGVAIGSLRDVKIKTVRVIPDIPSLFGGTKILKVVEAESVTLGQDALPRSRNWLKDAKPNALQVNRIVLNRVDLAVKDMELPVFDVVLNLAGNGKLDSALVKSSDNKLTANIAVQGEDLQIDISGKNWQLPLGPELMFDEIHGKALATRHELRISEIEGRLYGGSAKGSAKLAWEHQWNLAGAFSVSGLELKDAAPVFSKNVSLDGLLNASATYVMQSPAPAQLFNAPRLQATFNIVDGTLGNVDLVRAIQSHTATEMSGGQTQFEKLSGVLSLASNRVQLKQVTMSAGLLNANGSADVTQDHVISGRISAELGTKAAMNRAKMVVSGRVGEPVLRKGY